MMYFTPIARLTVVAQMIAASEYAKVIRFELPGVPHSLFPAKCAITLFSAVLQVNISLKRDGFAVTASVIGALHWFLSAEEK